MYVGNVIFGLGAGVGGLGLGVDLLEQASANKEIIFINFNSKNKTNNFKTEFFISFHFRSQRNQQNAFGELTKTRNHTSVIHSVHAHVSHRNEKG